jgi:hypothetical protein
LSSKISNIDLIVKYSYLFLLIPVFFIAYPLLIVPGIPIGNGDLPYIEISLFPDKKLWTWNEYGSFHGMEALPRYPIISFFNMIDLPPELTSKFLIVGLFTIASFSFYFSVSRLFKVKLDINNLRFRTMALVGSFFYAYNVWSFHRIGHWYFWLGYALLPLFFISVIYAFRYPRKLKYVIASAILWSVASSTPHMTIFFGIVFVGLSAKSIIDFIRERKQRSLLVDAVRPISLILLVYVSVNMYWIYPYLISSQSENFQWSAAVTEETTRELSRESDFLNVIRLLEGTFNMGKIDVIPNQSSDYYPGWVIASFVVPIIGFSALAWWKSNLFKYALFFSVVSAIGILLTMGTNAPFNLYLTMLFHIPMASIIQIILREPDKWGFLVAFGISFLVVISGVSILDKFGRLPYRKITSTIFVALLVGSMAFYIYPAYRDSTENLYRPIVVPTEFNRLNDNWNTVGANKTFVMPYAPYNTTWAKDKGVLDLYPVSAPVPNIAPSDYNNVEKYHKHLVNSIVRNRTHSIEDMIYPLGTTNLIYHNDSLFPQNAQLLKLMESLDGIHKVEDVGLFKIFDVVRDRKYIQQTEVLRDNTLVVGGLDRFGSLSFIPYFSTANSSLIFLDQQLKNDINRPAIEGADSLLLMPDKYSFILSLLQDKYILSPYEVTNHHEPTKFWSKAGSNDPGNAWFTPYLEDLGMQNWDFDYGKGLVLTKATGANLSIPFHLAESGQYDIFVRLLKNQKGGIMNVYLDDKLLTRINTLDKGTNSFEWQYITNKSDSFSLKEGKHALTLENVVGFNAVNIFAIMPSTDAARLVDYAHAIANRTRNIYVLEAESNFLVDNSVASPLSSSDYYYLLKNEWNSSQTSNRPFEETSVGQIIVPPDKDLLSLKLIAGRNGSYLSDAREDTNSSTDTSQPSYLVNDFKIFSANRSSVIYQSDFENKQFNIPLAGKARFSLGPYNALPLFLPENNASFDGNQNLNVNIRRGNTSDWNIVSTDFVPINDFSRSIQYNISVSANDVKQLHSKVVYYDSNKNETGGEFLFGGRDGTIRDTIANTLNVPNGTKFLKLQIFAAYDPRGESTYKIDKLLINPLAAEVWKNNNDLSSISLDQNLPVSGMASLKVDIEGNKNNDTDWSIISSDLIPVNDKAYYNMNMDVSAKNVSQLHSKIAYYDSKGKPILNLNSREEVNDIVFYGDGTFKKRFELSPSIPIGTKYLQLQIFASPLPGSASSYLIDNMKLEEKIPDVLLFDGNFASFEKLSDSTTLGRVQSEIGEKNETYRMDKYKEIQLAKDSADDSNLHHNNSLKVYFENNERERGLTNELINKSMVINSSFSGNSNVYDNNMMLESSNYSKVQTKPIPVRSGSMLNYDISAEGRNLVDFAVIASFQNSSSVTENSTNHGSNASGGSVLSLTPGSQIYSYVDILKPNNYALALRVGACESCSLLRLAIVDTDNDRTVKSYSIPLKPVTERNDSYVENNHENSEKESGSQDLKWVSPNDTVWLDRGKYEIRIDSDSNADLDSVVIYSDVSGYDSDDNRIEIFASNVGFNKNASSHQNLGEEDMLRVENQDFSMSQNTSASIDNMSRPAIIEDYKKINPTKHELRVENATRPFMISFAESYDPLWVAYADGYESQNSGVGISSTNSDDDKATFKTKSIPLYSVINGFYINKTGGFNLTIEYEPQKWFTEGSVISLVAIALSLGFLIVEKRRRTT